MTDNDAQGAKAPGEKTAADTAYSLGYADGISAKPRVDLDMTPEVAGAYEDGYKTGSGHRSGQDTVIYWGDRRIDDMTRDELLMVIRSLGREMEYWRDRTLSAHRFYGDLMRMRRDRGV